MSGLMDSLPALVSASGGGGIIGVIGTRVFDWGKTRSEKEVNEAIGSKMDAQAAAIIADTALALVTPLKKEMAELTARVVILEHDQRLAVEYIRTLLNWIARHVPDKTPPSPPVSLVI